MSNSWFSWGPGRWIRRLLKGSEESGGPDGDGPVLPAGESPRAGAGAGGRGRRGRRGHVCAKDFIGLRVRHEVDELIRNNAAWVSLRAFVELGVGRQMASPFCLPLRRRVDGASCGNANCRYRFLLTVLHRSMPAAERAASRHAQGGVLVRYFAGLTFRDVLAVDATSLPDLDERRVRSNDERAIDYLCALRDAGAYAVWIRATGGGAIVVIYTGVLGDGIEIDFEEPRTLVGGRWVASETTSLLTGAERPFRRLRRAGSPIALVWGWTWPRKLLFVAWEAVVALVAAALAKPLLGLLDTSVTVPLIPVIGVTLLVGAFVGARVIRDDLGRRIVGRPVDEFDALSARGIRIRETPDSRGLALGPWRRAARGRPEPRKTD